MQAVTDLSGGGRAVPSNGHNGNGNDESLPNSQRSHDLRQLMPVLGLREYWYPALSDSKVGRRKPVLVKMLGQDVCFFRGKSGKVVAVDNACPHRGAMLHKGHCDFEGTVACFYHGFVFDEQGLCVATLGEGPTSPMIGKLRAKTYPTVTLKGIVWIWMGLGEPVEPREDIPEDFFDPEVRIFSWTNTWPANWRPAVENYGDSHVRYVHRNSALMLMHKILPAALPREGKPYRVGSHRLAAPGRIGETRHAHPNAKRPYQDYYPLLGATWPKTKYRLAWTWIFDLNAKVRSRFRPAFSTSQEWGPGQHLPAAVRINYGTHMYTRCAVPVGEHVTRMFYFHSSKRSTLLGRLHEAIQWTAFHNWAMNKNFSEQDSPGAIDLYYDRRERLSLTDQQTIEWRKLVLSARGMESKAGASPADSTT